MEFTVIGYTAHINTKMMVSDVPLSVRPQLCAYSLGHQLDNFLTNTKMMVSDLPLSVRPWLCALLIGSPA